MQRIRIKYQKGVELQYTGNLDLNKVWERTFRRAKLPLAYSKGFHPQPKIHQACALPLGFTSRCELLDFWCDSEISVREIRNQLENTIQPGIKIVDVELIPLDSPVLQTIVESSDYQITFDENTQIEPIEQNLLQLLAADHCDRQRRGKNYDLRPLVKTIVLNKSKSATILMRLSVIPGATGRPEEVLDVLGIPPFSVDIERIDLIFSKPEFGLNQQGMNE
jgi:radical SAM-linked protein